MPCLLIYHSNFPCVYLKIIYRIFQTTRRCGRFILTHRIFKYRYMYKFACIVYNSPNRVVCKLYECQLNLLFQKHFHVSK